MDSNISSTHGCYFVETSGKETIDKGIKKYNPSMWGSRVVIKLAGEGLKDIEVDRFSLFRYMQRHATSIGQWFQAFSFLLPSSMFGRDEITDAELAGRCNKNFDKMQKSLSKKVEAAAQPVFPTTTQKTRTDRQKPAPLDVKVLREFIGDTYVTPVAQQKQDQQQVVAKTKATKTSGALTQLSREDRAAVDALKKATQKVLIRNKFSTPKGVLDQAENQLLAELARVPNSLRPAAIANMTGAAVGFLDAQKPGLGEEMKEALADEGIVITARPQLKDKPKTPATAPPRVRVPKAEKEEEKQKKHNLARVDRELRTWGYTVEGRPPEERIKLHKDMTEQMAKIDEESSIYATVLFLVALANSTAGKRKA